ncbi:hypothetical protein AOXY_G32406 [Acipenser oxyrinchus oxyrinchus]|uniref:Ig-like domain-containing protein n=1 Tax=Acipenser oxyrinchus oxyrinchus TaxID=40147 RepID=A0AAD8CJD9_ACIOX|nr:hypothetical protein AOXY_G32406 [Acipenser oxyrinchus oxyrinchus]
MWRILGYALAAVCFEVSETSLSLSSSHHFASPGESPVEFTCTSRAVIESGGVRLLWFRKNASDVMERLDTKCNESPCKYTNESNGRDTFKLKIPKTERDDSGTYYCAHPLVMDLEFSNGAALSVITDSSTETTSVSILAPAVSASALDSTGTLTLVCLARGLSSPAVRFQWFISGNVTTATAPGSGIKETGGGGESYSATSRLTIPAETWRSGAVCACGAQLNSSTVIRSREISYTAGASCRVYYAAFSGAALLAVAAAILATCAWLHFCSKGGNRILFIHPVFDLQMRCNDDLVTYAHLEFVPQKKGRRKRQA